MGRWSFAPRCVNFHDAIDYVAADSAGDTAPSTRTVIINPAAQVDTASTTPQ